MKTILLDGNGYFGKISSISTYQKILAKYDQYELIRKYCLLFQKKIYFILVGQLLEALLRENEKGYEQNKFLRGMV